MTLTLELPPDVEGAPAAEARRQGTTPEGLVLQDLRHRYTAEAAPLTLSAPQEDPTLALFAQWEAEYATDDPEELARRQREGDELMEALEANGRMTFEGRTDFRGLLDLDDDTGKHQQKSA